MSAEFRRFFKYKIMPKTKEQKKEILKQLQDKIKDSKSVVFSTDQGLDVKTVEALRKELKANKAEYMIAKKTLIKKAVKDVGEDSGLEDLTGTVGVTFSYEDEVSGAKIVNKFAKDNETLNFVGGILEGKFILPDMVKQLASIPSREQLLAKLVGSLNSPISGIVGVLSSNLRNLVGVLNAVKESKE